MKKVLYIEDNAVNTMLMEMIVSNLGGMELTCTEDAESGLSVASDLLPDIILMDIELPGIDGIEATRQLQRTEALRHIPVIVVSSDMASRTEREAREAGCAAYLMKPLAIAALVRTLEKYLHTEQTMPLGGRFEIRANVGDAVPDGEFKRLGAEGVETLTTADLFAGKRVLVIGVVGAFTPVCTARHLPEYLPYSDELTKAGVVDAVICVSAVDPFVMKAWGATVGVGDSIALLTDPDAAFAESLGLAVDLSDLGLGRRSTRYALFVNDRVIEIIRVEAQPGDLALTSADALRELIGEA